MIDNLILTRLSLVLCITHEGDWALRTNYLLAVLGPVLIDWIGTVEIK